MLLPLLLNNLLSTAGASAAVSGTTAFTEAQLVAGGEQIIITLTNDTWVASGATFDAQRQAIIDGLDSAQTETNGWNAEVRDKEVVGAVVRTSDTVVTVTLTASAAYNVTANETITVSVPSTALTAGNPLTGSPTIGVTARTNFPIDYTVEVLDAYIVPTDNAGYTVADIVPTDNAGYTVADNEGYSV